MTKREWDLIQQYIDTKIDYEIVRREEDEEGYIGNAHNEDLTLAQAEKAIDEFINKPLE